jgi:hypothetical protein
MTTIATTHPTIQRPELEYLVDDAQLAASAFLARYSARTPRRLPPRPAGLLPVGNLEPV